MKLMDAGTFLRDVESHTMTVPMNTGIYRHVRFRKPQNSNLWFDLVTWPGGLTIHGDMGTWTFARVPDMFKFFRNDNLRINPEYWSEKLHAGVHGGPDHAKAFDDELFRRQLSAHLDAYELEGDDLTVVSEALREDVLCQDGKYDLLAAARNFSCSLPGRPIRAKFQFDTYNLPTGEAYSYHFLWCLYAIVWGIQQFDVAHPSCACADGSEVKRG